MSSAKCIARVGAGIAVASLVAFGCSWDYLIWQKDKKSDTPLFRFAIREKDGAGYIDRDGKVVIRPTFFSFGNYGGDFFDGLAKVEIGREDWYIDASGKRMFRADVINDGEFSEGVAATLRNGKAGFVDRAGKLVISRSFASGEAFSEGLAVVGMNQGMSRLYGYIDKGGNFAVRPKFTLANAFSEGAARVIEDGQCTYVGHGPCSILPISLPYDLHGKQSPDLPLCLYSFIDLQGVRLFETKYPDAKDFAEDLAPVGDGKVWGYIDKKGSVVIPFSFENAEPFSEGLARVSIGGNWGYVDKTGRLVIGAVFQSALDFSEGLAVVGDGAKYWFIDRNGHRAIPHFYNAASSFVMGRAHVRNGTHYESAKWSYIDRTGHAVFTYSDQSNRKGK